MFYFKTLRKYVRVSLFLKTTQFDKKTKFSFVHTSAHSSTFSVSLKNVTSSVQKGGRIAEKINFWADGFQEVGFHEVLRVREFHEKALGFVRFTSENFRRFSRYLTITVRIPQ